MKSKEIQRKKKGGTNINLKKGRFSLKGKNLKKKLKKPPKPLLLKFFFVLGKKSSNKEKG
jgi:hypothetical protein